MAPLDRRASEISVPVNRIRWSSSRLDDEAGTRRRSSLLRRFHSRRRRSDRSRDDDVATKATAEAENGANGAEPSNGAAPAKRSSVADASESPGQSRKSDDASQSEPEDRRRVFFNMPLPEDARDENGTPKTHFARNKIRTAKYTALSFIPKNLYYQFHNVANLYFLFIIVLGVSLPPVPRRANRRRHLAYSAPPTPASTPPPSSSFSPSRPLRMP
jgi:phospholipid-translocating ATPase